MWLLYGLFIVVVVERVVGQNGPHVPETGMAVNAEGQLYGAKEVGNQEPVMGAATGYSTRYGGQANHNSGYGGSYGDNNNNNYGGGYNSNNNYGGSTSGSGYDSGSYNNAGCYGRQPGMYGDASYDCKTFQVCQADGRLDTLYCPPYTRFNNYLGVCDWHFKVDSYCNPLYKEEYNNNNNNYNSNSNSNYDSGYGNNNNNYGSSYDNKGSNYNSYGTGSNYNGAYSSNVASTGANTYSSGYRTPVYGLGGKY